MNPYEPPKTANDSHPSIWQLIWPLCVAARGVIFVAALAVLIPVFPLFENPMITAIYVAGSAFYWLPETLDLLCSAGVRS